MSVRIFPLSALHPTRAAVALLCIASALLTQPSHAGSILTSVNDKNGNPVHDAVVFAVALDAPAAAAERQATPLTIVQENYTFIPYVTVLRNGGSVRFANRDAHDHHIKSFSSAKTFETRIGGKRDDAAPVQFDTSGEVAMVCHFHDWMRGFVYVVDTPYFGKTDQGGSALLTNLPPGNYEVRVWVPKMFGEPLKQSRMVAGSDLARVKFDLNFIPAAPPKPVFPRKKTENGGS